MMLNDWNINKTISKLYYYVFLKTKVIGAMSAIRDIKKKSTLSFKNFNKTFEFNS